MIGLGRGERPLAPTEDNMPTTIKEWAEEYHLINAMEDQERRERLRHLSIEESVRGYETLCRLVAHLRFVDDSVLWEMRQSSYRDWEEKVRRIALRRGYALPI